MHFHCDQVSPKGFDFGAIQSACSKLAELLRLRCEKEGMHLKETVVQFHEGCSNRAPDDSPTFLMSDLKVPAKEAAVYEPILGLRFRISPTSFFQVNTKAAEALYAMAGEWALPEPDSNALLFDVCSGTGTIGITLAQRAGKVIGIEICESSVRDAEENAKLNNISNCTFICGKV